MIESFPAVARRWAVQYVQQPIVPPSAAPTVDVELETAFVKFMFQAISGRKLPSGTEPL